MNNCSLEHTTIEMIKEQPNLAKEHLKGFYQKEEDMLSICFSSVQMIKGNNEFTVS